MPSNVTAAARRVRLTLLTLLCAGAPLTAAMAAIVELDRDEFDSAIGGGGFVDDFQAYSPGLQPTPMRLANGVVFDSPAPFIAGDPERLLLGNDTPLSAPRRFIGFANDASLFGVDVVLSDSDEFDVVVLTTGGQSLVIEARRGNAFDGFFGVRIIADSLASISFSNVGGPSEPGSGGGGRGNFGFDNLTVDAVAAVPLPGGLGLALLPALWLARRQRVGGRR